MHSMLLSIINRFIKNTKLLLERISEVPTAIWMFIVEQTQAMNSSNKTFEVFTKGFMEIFDKNLRSMLYLQM